jgi:anti-sigma factor RsiW
MPNSSITCKDVAEFLMSYTDGEMPAQARSQFDEHLAICASCGRYVNQYQRTVRMGQQAFGATGASAEGVVPAGLLEAIRSARRSEGLGQLQGRKSG